MICPRLHTACQEGCTLFPLVLAPVSRGGPPPDRSMGSTACMFTEPILSQNVPVQPLLTVGRQEKQCLEASRGCLPH